MDLLSDPDVFVREAAAWPLSDLGRVEALPQLLNALQTGKDEGHDNDGLLAALADLVAANRDVARPALEALIAGDDAKLKAGAAWLIQFCETTPLR